MMESRLYIHKEMPIGMNMHFSQQWWIQMNQKSQVGTSNTHVQSYKP